MVLLSAGDKWDLCSIPQPIRHKATKDALNSPLVQGIPILFEDFEELKCGKMTAYLQALTLTRLRYWMQTKTSNSAKLNRQRNRKRKDFFK